MSEKLALGLSLVAVTILCVIFIPGVGGALVVGLIALLIAQVNGLIGFVLMVYVFISGPIAAIIVLTLCILIYACIQIEED